MEIKSKIKTFILLKLTLLMLSFFPVSSTQAHLLLNSEWLLAKNIPLSSLNFSNFNKEPLKIKNKIALNRSSNQLKRNKKPKASLKKREPSSRIKRRRKRSYNAKRKINPHSLRRKKNREYAARKRRKVLRERKSSRYNIDHTFNKLYSLYRNKHYTESSEKAFRLITNPDFKSYKNSLHFILGSSLYNLGLYQAASFQFANVIRRTKDKNLIKKNLTNLYLAANKLEDSSLIKAALSKINIKRFPKTHKDLLYLRIGETHLQNKNFKKAIRILKRIPRSSSIYLKSKYLLALAYSETRRNRSALRAFNELYILRGTSPKNDPIKTAAIIGQARVLYQGKKWNRAIEIYNEVPKDTELWHDSLIERSWSLLRVGKFRSALSILHSLHSTFYENFYAPELILLRSIVYLYICKYDEMEKTLNLYKKIYVKLKREIKLYLKNTSNPSSYFLDTIKTINNVKKNQPNSPISPLLAFKIYKDGQFQDLFKYIQNLKKEKEKLKTLPQRWRGSSLGRYVTKLIEIRMAKSYRMIGRVIKKNMNDIYTELIQLSAQEELIRFEMINSEKTIVKKLIRKEIKTDTLIDKNKKRNFYVQNGYNYWPFRGEYWLDEIGNYYYFGHSSCYKE